MPAVLSVGEGCFFLSLHWSGIPRKDGPAPAAFAAVAGYLFSPATEKIAQRLLHLQQVQITFFPLTTSPFISPYPGRLVVLGLTALCDSFSVYIGSSPKER